MKKIKFDKAAVLTIVSAVCGVGGFIANALSSKDEEERIAQRAAEILQEQSTKEGESYLRALFLICLCR